MTDRNKETKRKRGRPRLIESPEEMDDLVEKYLDHCQEEGHPITLTGLCLYLGFSSRQSLTDYAKRPGFSDSVKKARLIVEYAYELDLRIQKPFAHAESRVLGPVSPRPSPCKPKGLPSIEAGVKQT